MRIASIVFKVKRCLTRYLGLGPWRIASFDSIAGQRTTYADGVHRPEDFTGVIFANSFQPTYFSQEKSLIGQCPEPEVVAEGTRYVEKGLYPASPVRVYSLSEAGAISSDGVVYCLKTRRAVAESFRSWEISIKDHPALVSPRYPSAARLPGLTLSLLTLSGEGFYHYLLESIPRLCLLRPWLKLADHVLSAGSANSIQTRWLEYAGVPLEKVVWMNGLCHVTCDQLLFTDYPMRDQLPSEWIVEAIRSSFPSPRHKSFATGRRIWISRGDATSRILHWEDDLLALLPEFSRIHLAELTPAEQISLAANAEVVAGPHGAGFSNMVFGQHKAKVIELFPVHHYKPVYGRLASVVGLSYTWAMVDFQYPPPDLHDLAQAVRSFCDS